MHQILWTFTSKFEILQIIWKNRTKMDLRNRFQLLTTISIAWSWTQNYINCTLFSRHFGCMHFHQNRQEEWPQRSLLPLSNMFSIQKIFLLYMQRNSPCRPWGEIVRGLWKLLQLWWSRTPAIPLSNMRWCRRQLQHLQNLHHYMPIPCQAWGGICRIWSTLLQMWWKRRQIMHSSKE